MPSREQTTVRLLRELAHQVQTNPGLTRRSIIESLEEIAAFLERGYRQSAARTDGEVTGIVGDLDRGESKN